jgi:hypothetical protein
MPVESITPEEAPGVLRLVGEPRHDRSCGLQRADAPTAGLEPYRAGPADRNMDYSWLWGRRTRTFLTSGNPLQPILGMRPPRYLVGMAEKWHAVSIVGTPSSCHPARELRGIRFLSAEAPRLPLPTCRAGSLCPCAYKHYDDRRGQPRRAEDLSGFRRPIVSGERRQQRGRRSTDF